MKRSRILSLCLALSACICQVSAQQITYSVKNIYGDGTTHCAFTSLIEYEGHYYCAFREGASHIFDEEGKAEGKIRIISSEDGDAWESVALVGKEGCDFRDPKLSIMPDGRILVNFVASIYRNRKLQSIHPYVMFSSDGKTYTEPELSDLDDKLTSSSNWIWRVTWHEQTGYAINYVKVDGAESWEVWLLETRDGKSYNVITRLDIDGRPNEATIRFAADGRMTAMVRREKGDRCGWFGVSDYPYTEWNWRNMGLQLGGPDYLYLDDGRIIMSTRNTAIKNAPKTSIYKGTTEGNFEEIIVLPSGGDCSYPSMMVVGDEMWISYYSSHVTKLASVYLARIPLSTLDVL